MKQTIQEIISREFQENDAAGLDGKLQFAVIVSRYQGQWVFCKHKDRETLEAPGGHWEQGERIEETARRELYEETGAKEFQLFPVLDYGVQREGEQEASWGRLFYAEITSFDPLPEFEIEKVVITGELPSAWTYPLIQPQLLKWIDEWLTNQKDCAKVNKIIVKGDGSHADA